MTLTKVEDALKALKVDLGMRPTYHQLARRTAAQLFIAVLACHLLSAVELTVRQDNDKKRWSTIKEQLTSHYRATIVLASDKGVFYDTRAHSVRDPVPKETYHLLGVSDPLGRIKTSATHLQCPKVKLYAQLAGRMGWLYERLINIFRIIASKT